MDQAGTRPKHERRDDPSIRVALEAHFQSPLIERPWLCDVKAVNATIIQAHNRVAREMGQQVEEKFASVTPSPGRLADLLKLDFEYLCKGVPWLAKYASEFAFFEIEGPLPHAEIVSLDTELGPLHAVGFRACLLRFLHASYSKMCMLTAHARHADCLEENDEIMAGEEYSDTSLMAGFYNDIEMLFDLQRVLVPIFPPHFASPYDYCGRVDGTRRFILAHEIGHVLWRDQDRSALAAPLLKYGHGEERSLRWAEELWCDSFALQALLAVYGEEPLETSRLYDAEDLVCGIMQYTTIMDIIEVVLAEYGVIALDHPPSAMREHYLKAVIKEHRLFQVSPEFSQSVPRVWRRLKVFARYLGGIGTPSENGSLWSRDELLARLSPFGRKAYDLIAEQSNLSLAERTAVIDKMYQANRRAIERGFMPDPRDAPRFVDQF